jgi:hypothetical protein
MKSYRGTETVEPGLYFNLRQLAFKSIDTTGALPGNPEDVYRRVPVLALLLVGPVMGLAFVVFLPFIGFAMVGWLLARKAAKLARGERTTPTPPARGEGGRGLTVVRPAPTLAGASDAPTGPEKLDPAERDAA